MIELTISEDELKCASQQPGIERMINGHTHRIRERLTRCATISPGEDSTVCLSSIYDACGVMDLLWKGLRSERVAPELAMSLAAFRGADYGRFVLGEIGSGMGAYFGSGAFAQETLDLSRSYPLPVDEMLHAYGRVLDQHLAKGAWNVTMGLYGWVCEHARSHVAKLTTADGDGALVKGTIAGSYSYCGLDSGCADSKTNRSGTTRSWDRIGGYHGVVSYFQDLELIIREITNPRSPDNLSYKELLPKGVVLVGPPGTGKTTVARTFCESSGVPYELVGVSEVGSPYVFETANNIQRRFARATLPIARKESAISVVVFDELEALCMSRSAAPSHSGEDNKCVSTLNYNMDGHLAVQGVMVIGATNRLDLVDPSLLRPGRFSEVIHMNYPSDGEVQEIFKVYLDGDMCCSSIDAGAILKRFPVESSGSRGSGQAMPWTGALVHEIITRAKRSKLIRRLKGEGDGSVTTEDVLNELSRWHNGC